MDWRNSFVLNFYRHLFQYYDHHHNIRPYPHIGPLPCSHFGTARWRDRARASLNFCGLLYDECDVCNGDHTRYVYCCSRLPSGVLGASDVSPFSKKWKISCVCVFLSIGCTGYQRLILITRTCLAWRLSRLTLHVVNTGPIPVVPSHGEMRLLIHPGNVLNLGPKARRILRSGMNLEGMAEQSTDVLDLVQVNH